MSKTTFTVTIDLWQKECILIALQEKAARLSPTSEARVNYEQTYKELKKQLIEQQ